MNDDELCPCGSEKPYEKCCKKAYDQANQARDKIKAAMQDPKKAKELKALLEKMKQNQGE